MNAEFEYVFPSIRGVQAGREYYVSMCPLRLITKMFLFDEEELVPELRVQRVLNKARVPEMANYMLNNRDTYVFSAITASIDGTVRFEPTGGGEGHKDRLGVLHVPMDAKFIINDGQHRRAAIEMALRQNHDLAEESIAVVFFLDRGLERAQQMFADLNRYAIRPSKSLGVLYDHREDVAKIARLVALKCPAFKGLVEMERSTVTLRSRRLFTLSAIYHATRALLDGRDSEDAGRLSEMAVSFWDEVAKYMPEWRMVREGKIAASDVRREFIHTHGIALLAIGKTGHDLLRTSESARKAKLGLLRKIDWSRSNTTLWEGRAMIGGRVSKAANNVILTTNALKTRLGLQLTAEERRVERSLTNRSNG